MFYFTIVNKTYVTVTLGLHDSNWTIAQENNTYIYHIVHYRGPRRAPTNHTASTGPSLLKIWAATWDFQQCGMCDQQSLRLACIYAQSDQSLCLSLAYSMNVKLLTEHHLEFLSLKGGCTGSSESTLVKMPHCWKSQIVAHYGNDVSNKI